MFKLRGSFLNTGLKLSIFILLAAGLYWQLSGQASEKIPFIGFDFTTASVLLLSLVILLMPLNWGLEAIKWKRLIAVLQQIPLKTAFEAVLSGVTLGLITPNRIGEYGGRILYLQAGSRLRAIEPSLAGSLAQIIVTVALGSLAGMVFIIHQYTPGPILLLAYAVVTILLNAFLLIAYFRFGPVVEYLSRWALLRRFRRFTGASNALTDRDLFMVLAWSATRYLVFTAQYLLLLELYGVSIHPIRSAQILALVFFVQTVLPTFALVELIKRGSVAVFFFAFYTENEWGVLAASSTIWAINLILPAMAGYVLMLRKNLFIKSLPNDEKHGNSHKSDDTNPPVDRKLADHL